MAIRSFLRDPIAPTWRCLAVAAGILLCSCLLADCSRGPAVPVTDPALAVPDGASTRNEWATWDWRIDRPQLVVTYLTKVLEPANPFDTYRETFRYDAEFDSLGPAEFLALPASECVLRRRSADASWREAMRLRTIIMDVHRANWEGESVNTCGDCPPPNGAGDGVTRALRHLNNAVGLDPTNPYIWYDLAYFAGVVGDWKRQHRALDAAQAAVQHLDQVGVAPATRSDAHTAADAGTARSGITELQLRIALDYAWLAWERGDDESCGPWLERADSLLVSLSPRPVGQRWEILLVQGLVHAQSGDFIRARQVAALLREIPVYVRDRHRHTDIRYQSNPLIKTAWWSRPNAFAGQWIRAVVQMEQGKPELALEILDDIDVYNELPAQLNYRFWNGMGLLYEQCGQMDKARTYYSLAAINRPYFTYFPLIGAQGAPRIHGQSGCGMPYFVGYRHFYLAGSLFAYAANTEISFEVEREPRRRAALAEAAREALTTCRKRNIRPTAALALRGRVHFFSGDYDAAAADLRTAHEEFLAADREDPDVILLTGLIAFDRQDFTTCVSWLKRYVELRPQQAAGWLALGLARFYCGEPGAALSALDRAVAIDPGYAAAWFNRGLLRYHEQDVPGARDDLEQASQLAPDDPAIARMLTIARHDRYRPINVVPSPFELGVSREDSLAIAQLRLQRGVNVAADMQAIDPELGAGWLDLEGASGEALLDDLRAAYTAEPTPATRRYLAWCYLQRNQAERARALLLPLWGKDMSAVELRLLLEADRALGDPQRAVALARSLERHASPVNDPEVWTLVLATCLDHGQRELALRALETALQLDPDNVRLQAFRSQLTD